ncbi:hypothetical protein NMY22_g19905 [Coprinellus aureogranulatus]|nr:hypothetical protein NMY22_g19905 [Coprinellus aureogranulatus]
MARTTDNHHLEDLCTWRRARVNCNTLDDRDPHLGGVTWPLLLVPPKTYALPAWNMRSPLDVTNFGFGSFASPSPSPLRTSSAPLASPPLLTTDYQPPTQTPPPPPLLCLRLANQTQPRCSTSTCTIRSRTCTSLPPSSPPPSLPPSSLNPLQLPAPNYAQKEEDALRRTVRKLPRRGRRGVGPGAGAFRGTPTHAAATARTGVQTQSVQMDCSMEDLTQDPPPGTESPEGVGGPLGMPVPEGVYVDSVEVARGQGGERPRAPRQGSLPAYSALDPYAGGFGEGSGDMYGEGYGVGVGRSSSSPQEKGASGLEKDGGDGRTGGGGGRRDSRHRREAEYEESSTSSYGNPDYPQTLGGASRSEFANTPPLLGSDAGVGGGDGDESLIGSNASDLRPGGRIRSGVDVDGGGMVNPKSPLAGHLDADMKRGAGGGGGKGGGSGRSSVSRIPAEVDNTREWDGEPRSAVSGVRGVGHAFSPESPARDGVDGVGKGVGANGTANANGNGTAHANANANGTAHANGDLGGQGRERGEPSSRKSALLRLSPDMLVGFVLRAEADYDSLSQLYTQALAEAAIAKHQSALSLQKLERKLKEVQESEDELRKRVVEVENEKNARDGVIVQLEKRVRDKEREVKDVKREVKEREREVREKEREVEGERERRRKEEVRRKELEKSLEPLKDQITDLQSTLTRTRNEAAQRLAALQAEKG